MVVSGSSSVSGLHRETTVLSLVMAYRSFGRFRQASTRLDTPPCSGRHHPVSAIALRLGANDALPDMAGEAVAASQLTFDPTSITFLAIPSANNQVVGEGCDTVSRHEGSFDDEEDPHAT